MRVLRHALCLLLTLTSTTASAQVDVAWTRPVDIGVMDYLYSIAVDSSHNLLLAGSSGTLWETESMAAVTVKLSPLGDTLWTNRIDGTTGASDAAVQIIADQSGNCYLVGRSTVVGQPSDALLASIDSLGMTRWTSFFDAPGGASATGAHVVLDRNGNVWVLGNIQDPSSDHDLLILKYSNGGELKTQYRFGSSGAVNDAANGLAVDNASNLYVLGGGTLLKFDSSVSLLWQSPAPGRMLSVDPAGSAYVGGWLWISERSDYDLYLTRFSPDGVRLWADTIDGPGHNFELPQSMSVDPSGSIYLTGETRDTIEGGGPILWKFSSDGDLLWIRRQLGSTGRACIAVDASCVYNLVDGCFPIPTCGRMLTKLSANGDSIWSVMGPITDEPKSGPLPFVADGEHGFYYGGSHDVNGTGMYFDFMATKLATCSAAPPVPGSLTLPLGNICMLNAYRLAWEPVDASFAYYDLYENGRLIRSTADRFADLSNPPGDYWYQLGARNSCGSSGLSGPAQLVVVGDVPDPGPAPQASAVTPCSDVPYVVSWSPVPGASAYQLFENGYVIQSGPDTQFVRTERAGHFSYRVAVRNECGSGDLGAALDIYIAECYCHGDPVCDGTRMDVLDVLAVVDIAFENAPQFKMTTCPAENTDFDCDGCTDIRDVVSAIDVAFRGANPDTRFCNPCP